MLCMMLMMLCVPMFVCGSDVENKQQKEKMYKCVDVNAIKTLTVIQLPHCNIDDDTFKWLVNKAHVANTIDLSHNNITNFPNGMQSDSVKELNVSNNGFTGKFPLSTCLSTCKNLEILKLNNNKVTDFEFDRNRDKYE